MINKILFSFALLALVLSGVGFVGAQNANAQVVFPPGCSSNLGYSVTTGIPCTGTGTVVMPFLPGCSTALGYSTTNGVACDGGAIAISYLAGCSSIYGYSTITSMPCNGTAVAGIDPGTVVITTPGLPVTGAGADAPQNVALLALTGFASILGIAYIVRRSRVVSR